MEVLSPIGTPFKVGPPGPTWDDKRTGTSFLPKEAVERAAEGNPIEKAKLAKDATTAYNSVYEYAAAIRAGTMDWEDVEKMDMNTRLKWVGLVHRDKRTPGRFMMRMRMPNGIVNSDLMRFYAECVEPHGPELGVIDITTRQNIQLRGVELEAGGQDHRRAARARANVPAVGARQRAQHGGTRRSRASTTPR